MSVTLSAQKLAEAVPQNQLDTVGVSGLWAGNDANIQSQRYYTSILVMISINSSSSPG
jgi:hypothetical protein